jgi:hypothetical protein
VGIFLRDTELPRHLSKRVLHHFKNQRYKVRPGALGLRCGKLPHWGLAAPNLRHSTCGSQSTASPHHRHRPCTTSRDLSPPPQGYDPQNVLNRLPFELKSKLLRQMYASTIRSVPLLQKQADDDLFVTDVCIRLQEYNCAGETFVYQRGEPAARRLRLLSPASWQPWLRLDPAALRLTLLVLAKQPRRLFLPPRTLPS